MSDLDETIEEFESGILEALRLKYAEAQREIAESLIELSPVTKIDIKEFRNAYQAQSAYPIDRLEKLIHLLMDVKIQLFFILELDIGLYNRLIADQGFTSENINRNPYMVLRKFSLDQNLIIKSRILFERVMNLIYFLETGKDLEVGRSKKSKFFKFSAQSGKWAFWEDYREYIEWFDNSLRLPEVHKGSILKKHFMAKTIVPDEKILTFSNIIMNVFWPSLIGAIQGREFKGKYWFFGMDVSKSV